MQTVLEFQATSLSILWASIDDVSDCVKELPNALAGDERVANPFGETGHVDPDRTVFLHGPRVNACR